MQTIKVFLGNLDTIYCRLHHSFCIFNEICALPFTILGAKLLWRRHYQDTLPISKDIFGISKLRWWFRQILWPYQKTSTLIVCLASSESTIMTGKRSYNSLSQTQCTILIYRNKAVVFKQFLNPCENNFFSRTIVGTLTFQSKFYLFFDIDFWVQTVKKQSIFWKMLFPAQSLICTRRRAFSR